jgi:hypothetical protein
MAGQNQRSVTRDLPRLSLRASFDLTTVNVEKRTVDLVWTTGARVLRGYFEPYFEELSLDPKHVRMGRMQSGRAPVLNSHRSDDIKDILGVVENATLGKKEGRATARFDTGPEGEDAFRRVREGTLSNVSVGYTIYRMQKVEDGASTVPVYKAVDWEPAELSLLPIGADAGAGTRAAGALTPCEFIQERAMETDATTTTPPAAPATPTAPTTPAPQLDAQRAAEIKKLERERANGIRSAGLALRRPETEIQAAIDNDTPLDAYRAAAIDAVAKATPAEGGPLSFDRADSRVAPGADQRDKFLQRSENWLLQRSGQAKLVAEAAKSAGKTVDLDPGESRGLSLLEVARECLERVGVRTRGMDPMQLVGLAFTHRGAGMNSTSDFAVILENTLNKTLLAAYATTPDTWRRWCITGTLTDFRQQNRYRQGSIGVLPTVLEGGEFTNIVVPDGEKQTITGGTKGGIIAITRQTIVNDDMGALTDISTRVGRSTALTIEVAAYAALLSNGGNGPTMSDGNPLFHASHGNIGAGGAALSVATVEADRVLMKSQQDPAKNEYLELAPAVLLVPVGLGGLAKVINNAQYDVDKVANARNQEPNKVVGLYRDVVDTARLTGTTRYSFADPAIAPVFEVGFVGGVETPYMETQQGWRIDGVEMKARVDFGLGCRDWRGVVRNPGA